MIPAEQLVDRVLDLATVDETIVIVTDTSEASLRWAESSMTTNGVSTSRSWTVVSVSRTQGESRVGIVTSSSVDSRDIAAVVSASESAARAARPASDAMPLVTGARAPEDWDHPAARTEIGVFEQLAQDLSQGFDGSDRLYGFAHHQMHTTWLASSTGVRRRHVQPTGSVEINGKRGDASAWVGTGTTDFTDVATVKLLEDLSHRLDWSSRTVELPAGRYETVLPPSAVADLMIYLMWMMEGRSAHEGRSALSRAGGTRVGERLGALPFTLYSDPATLGLETCPFLVTGHSDESVSIFDNGMDLPRTDWIRDGVVNALSYPRSAAREFAGVPAPPGANLVLDGEGSLTVDQMVAETERGLLLTTLWYIREVDPATLLLTGITRDGVYLVENGEVVGALNNFRFNESPLDLLRRASQVGATERTLPREWKDWFTRTAMPSLRVPDFHMSSVSEAR
ncbi:metallopeptidase TldD-related protein [Rhodococcus sp. NPDC058521]|uniref:metallopeptidase TldD-related protein n=1 Tax=Rhodococcus sp. NPDC058521 TaxID=3346536 RepID=UPI003652FEF2